MLEETSEINYIISVEDLEFIREKIEAMNKFSQVEVLRLLKQYDTVTLNENKYGIHINLSELPKNIIDKLLLYIDYVNGQENNLNQAEEKKRTYKNIYFTKDIKEIIGK